MKTAREIIILYFKGMRQKLLSVPKIRRRANHEFIIAFCDQCIKELDNYKDLDVIKCFTDDELKEMNHVR